MIPHWCVLLAHKARLFSTRMALSRVRACLIFRRELIAETDGFSRSRSFRKCCDSPHDPTTSAARIRSPSSRFHMPVDPVIKGHCASCLHTQNLMDTIRSASSCSLVDFYRGLGLQVSSLTFPICPACMSFVRLSIYPQICTFLFFFRQLSF